MYKFLYSLVFIPCYGWSRRNFVTPSSWKVTGWKKSDERVYASVRLMVIVCSVKWCQHYTVRRTCI